MLRAAITVPCYNEARRFQAREFDRALADSRVDLVFVNDGSTDDTEPVLTEFCRDHADRAVLINLVQNSGKSEAVRTGMLRSLHGGADVCGFADADLATPIDELLRLIDVMAGDDRAMAVLASRVSSPGADIDRRFHRRVLGRVFSALGSAVLGTWISDTQCGAKMFRNCEAIRSALSAPFRSRWAFDVELLGRFMLESDARPGAGIVEVPLSRWAEVPGSKLGASSMLRAGLDLAGVAADLRRLRRR
jgi:glycosyltransferase involved in cell wall biosynthesis